MKQKDIMEVIKENCKNNLEINIGNCLMTEKY